MKGLMDYVQLRHESSFCPKNKKPLHIIITSSFSWSIDECRSDDDGTGAAVAVAAVSRRCQLKKCEEGQTNKGYCDGARFN